MCKARAARRAQLVGMRGARFSRNPPESLKGGCPVCPDTHQPRQSIRNAGQLSGRGSNLAVTHGLLCSDDAPKHTRRSPKTMSDAKLVYKDKEYALPVVEGSEG